MLVCVSGCTRVLSNARSKPIHNSLSVYPPARATTRAWPSPIHAVVNSVLHMTDEKMCILSKR